MAPRISRNSTIIDRDRDRDRDRTNARTRVSKPVERRTSFSKSVTPLKQAPSSAASTEMAHEQPTTTSKIPAWMAGIRSIAIEEGAPTISPPTNRNRTLSITTTVPKPPLMASSMQSAVLPIRINKIKKTTPLPDQNTALTKSQTAKKPNKVVKPSVSDKTRKIIKDVSLFATKLKEQLSRKVNISSEPGFVSTNDLLTAISSKKTPVTERINSLEYIQTSHVENYRKIISINDEKNRIFFTKPEVLEKLSELTGTTVTCGGKYYPDARLAALDMPPIFLRIVSTDQELVDKANAKIFEFLAKDSKYLQELYQFNLDEEEYKNFIERRSNAGVKVPISLPSTKTFNVGKLLVGKKGENVKHINNISGCKVRLKGRGSFFINRSTGKEEDVPLYFHILGKEEKQCASAREMCLDLLNHIKELYDHDLLKKSERRKRKKERRARKLAGEDVSESEGGEEDNESEEEEEEEEEVQNMIAAEEAVAIEDSDQEVDLE